MGWEVTVYRQTDVGASPAKPDSPTGTTLAEWSTGWDGLDWLEKLVEAGKAIDLGGDGYPCKYTVIAEYLVPWIILQPSPSRPIYRAPRSFTTNDEGHIKGNPVASLDAIAQCRIDEWLIVEAWDTN